MSANTIDVVGPLKTKEEAERTADCLGRVNHSVYSRAIKDKDGYYTDDCAWYVERDLNVVGKILGYDADQFMAKQHRRG